MTMQTREFPTMFVTASRECTVVMAIWVDSDDMVREAP